jgi:hypothetical protein
MIVRRRKSSVIYRHKKGREKEICRITDAIIIVRQKVRRVIIDRHSAEVAVSFFQSWQSIRPMTRWQDKEGRRWVRP